MDKGSGAHWAEALAVQAALEWSDHNEVFVLGSFDVAAVFYTTSIDENVERS